MFSGHRRIVSKRVDWQPRRLGEEFSIGYRDDSAMSVTGDLTPRRFGEEFSIGYRDDSAMSVTGNLTPRRFGEELDIELRDDSLHTRFDYPNSHARCQTECG
jgi:hypothetical protein